MGRELAREGIYSLETLLRNPSSFSWESYVQFPRCAELSGDMSVYVYDLSDFDDPDELPRVAVERGLTAGLSIQAVQGIVKNAEAQLGAPSLAQLLAALNHYFVHDAYLAF